MESVSAFRLADQSFAPYGEDVHRASIAKLIGPDRSTTIGAGLANFDGNPISWTVQYDEVSTVIRGEFYLTANGDRHTLQSGDVIWIPRGTEVQYAGLNALVFYALYPVGWEDARHAA